MRGSLMYTAKILFKPHSELRETSVEELLSCVTWASEKKTDRHWKATILVTPTDDRYEMYFSIPELGSWHLDHANKHVRDRIEKLKSLGVLEFIDCGKAFEN